MMRLAVGQSQRRSVALVGWQIKAVHGLN